MKGVKFQLPQANKGTPQGDAKSEIEFVLELENMINKPVDWEKGHNYITLFYHQPTIPNQLASPTDLQPMRKNISKYYSNNLMT